MRMEPVTGGRSSKVYVLYTGGTFGMKPNENKPGAPLSPMELDELRKELPDASVLAPGVKITLDRFNRLLDSSAMTPDDWINIAKRIEQNYHEHDGFIVVQGTDTLAYTASALSFMLENLAKPVVVTGSQLPLTNPRTDAKLNYGHALQIAGYKTTDLPRIPEVIVVFADKILRGCRTRKMSASAWTGFDTPNCPPLGEIGERLRIYESQIRPPPAPGVDFQVNAILNADVLDLSLFPGLKATHLKQILSLDNVKGVVLRTYGTGNAPDEPAFLDALREGITKADKVVVNITQCPQGMVEMGLYETSLGLIDNGVISGLDMTPEAALAKLMVTMGTRVGGQVKLQMQISQRGEQSQNLFDFQFEKMSAISDQPWQ
ncbi:MAG: asparaginase, partial [Alphaproteobacteria bacterium]